MHPEDKAVLSKNGIYLNIGHIRDIRKDDIKFTSYIRFLVIKCGVNIAIKALKISDIAFDRGTRNCNLILLKKCLSILKDEFNFKYEVKKFNEEVLILEKLYKYLKNKIHENDNTIEEKNRFSLFLIMMENYLSLNLPASEFQDQSVLSKTYFDISWFCQPQNDFNDTLLLFNKFYALEELIFSLKYPLQYLIHERKLVDESMSINEEHFNITCYHLEFTNQWFLLQHLYELWAYSDADIQCNSNVIKFNVNKIDDYKAWMISNYRHRATDSNIAAKQNFHINTVIKKNPTRLPPLEYISPDERHDQICAAEYFYAFDLEEKIFDIPINVWIRAYNNLKIFAKKELKRRTISKVSKSYFQKFFKIQSKEKWCSIIARHGVHAKYANIIFDYWIFNRKSRTDLFDNPFLEVGSNKYLLFCSIASILHPMYCLISILRSYDSLRFRGDKFEDAIELILKKYYLPYLRNIKIKKYYQNSSSENPEEISGAEFDFLIKINGVLIVVELKCHAQSFSFDEHYDTYYKFYHSVRKIKNNKAKFFDNFDKLKLKYSDFFYNWNPQIIKHLILCSYKFGQSFVDDECLALDIDSFISLLLDKGEKNCKSTMDKIISPYGETIYNKLLNEVQLSRSVESIQKMCELVTKKVALAEFKIEFPEYNKIEPDMYFKRND